MVYSFVRVGAATAMNVEDVFSHNRRLWVRLQEKVGKRHEMPCHHNLEAYIDGCGLAVEPKAALFQIVGRRSGGQLTSKAISQRDTHDIIRRRDELSLDEVERVVI